MRGSQDVSLGTYILQLAGEVHIAQGNVEVLASEKTKSENQA